VNNALRTEFKVNQGLGYQEKSLLMTGVSILPKTHGGASRIAGVIEGVAVDMVRIDIVFRY
jgi:hypothetical protein